MRVGLTGGIGAGKSAVADLFRGWGAIIVDADLLAREVVAPGTSGWAEIARRWPSIVALDGSLDRRALAAIVFSDPAARAELNALVHPRVRERAAAVEAAMPGAALIVHVVPLLFEGDFWRTCARTVLVIAPRDARIARVVARDGVTPEAVERRMSSQIDPSRAAELADYVIANDADSASLATRARVVYEALTKQVAV